MRLNFKNFTIALCMSLFILPRYPACAEAPENLIKNSSFAEALKEWEFIGPKDMRPELDSSVFHGMDMASVRFNPQNGMRCVYLDQKNIPVNTKTKKYRVSGWRKCQGVPPGWESGICVNWSGTQSLCPANSEWTRDETVVTVKEDAQTIAVQIYLRPSAKTPPSAGGGSVWYDDISIEPVLADKQQVPPPQSSYKPQVSVVSFHPLGEKGLFSPGEHPSFILSLRNNDNAPAELETDIKVKDFNGNPSAGTTVKVKVPGSSDFIRTLDIPTPEKSGYFSVRAEIKKSGSVMGIASTAFCAVAPFTGSRDSFFGIDPNGLIPDMLGAFKTIGVGSLGIYQSWNVPEQSLNNPKEYFQKCVNERLAPYWKSDFTLVSYIKIDPGFSPKKIKDQIQARRQQGTFPYPDALFTELSSAVEAEAEVMKGRVKNWIICEEIDAWMQNPNTPAGSGTCELARHILMTRIAYNKLKQVIPDAFVPGLAVCTDYNSDPPYQLVRRVLPELKCDAIGVHPYCGNHQLGKGAPAGPEAGKLRDTLLLTRKIQTEHGMSKTLVIPEKGLAAPYHTPPDHPLLQTHANLHARNLIVAKSVGDVFFYSLHMGVWAGKARDMKAKNIISTDENPVSDYGIWKNMLDAKGADVYEPRAAVAAYATVARMLSNANDITPLEVKPRAGCYAYIFKRKNETIASVWTTDPEPYSVRVKLPVQMDCVDLMGNSRGIPAGDTELTLSESPQFLSGAVTPETMSQIIEKAVFPSVPAVRAEAALSDSSTLAVYLVNQTNSPAKTEIKLDPLKNVKLQTLSQKLTVPPSGRASASFTMTGASPETLKGETVTGNVSADGQAVKLSAELSVIPVPRAPKGMKVDGDLSKYAAMTPIILNGLKDIFPPMAQMPESGLWTGPDDLSVKSWLTWDEKFLYIAMRVVDDIHIQRQTGGNIWMDDCVQFAINAKNDALSPKITGSAGCGTSDYNMGMALTSSGPQCWRWVDKGVTKKAGLTDFPLSIRRDGNVTSYELAIPWDAVAPLSPKSGSVFKFSFVVFDQDKAGDSQAAYYMALTPGIAGGQDPSAYKTFMLTR